MRNLKRALSLTLASVMLLGMMVVGTSAAAGYSDVTDENNVEAIEVLQTIEVMVGDERGFGPDRPVNRAEMAVVMGKLLNLDYDYYSTSCPFNDVYDWARGWVGACYANKIVSGRGEGVYDPGSTVTAVEAASMLMRALGYFQYANDVADGFELSTVRQGTKIGIFDGVGSSATEPMTRDQVAKMVLNALQSAVVEPDGNTINLTTPDGTVLTGKVNYVSVTSWKDFARAIGKTQATSVGSNNDGYIVELGERLYDGKLKLDDDQLDDFRRPARRWEYDGKEIGTYVKKELLRAEYTDEVTGKMLYELLGSAVTEVQPISANTYSFLIAIDGENANGASGVLVNEKGDDFSFNRNDMIRTNTDGVGGTGKGVLTQVYVDGDKKIVYIAVINTYLGIAAEDYDEKDDEVDLDVYNVEDLNDDPKAPLYVKAKYKNTTDDSINITIPGDDFAIKDVKDGDKFLIRVAKGEVQEMVAPEIVSEATATAFKKRADNSPEYVIANGTQYDAANTALYDVEVLYNWTGSGLVNLKDLTYNVILDHYGYMIGVELNEDPNQYVFITGSEGGSSNLGDKNVDMGAIFTDGTFDVITVNTKDSKNSAAPGSVTEAGPIVNTWCTYTVDKNGIYTLKQVGATIAEDNRKVAQYDMNCYVDGDPDNDKTININKKHVSLDASSSTFAYGNDKSVYLNVSLSAITSKTEVDYDATGNQTMTGVAKKWHTGEAGHNTDLAAIIDEVESVTVGVKNADIKVTNVTKATVGDMDGKDYSSTDLIMPQSEVYTLYDKDMYIIAAVVIGEAQYSNSSYAYIQSSGIGRESYDKDADEWTWTRSAIVEGEVTTLKEVGSQPKYLEDLVKGHWYKLNYDADGNVRGVTALDGTGTKTLDNTATGYDKDGFISDVADKDVAVDAEDFVILRVMFREDGVNEHTGKTTTGEACTNHNIQDAKGYLTFKEGTLYTDYRQTEGFSVSPEVKVILAQAKGTTEFDKLYTNYPNSYEGLKRALRALNTDEDGYFSGDISAVLEGGVATSIIINDIGEKDAGGSTPPPPSGDHIYSTALSSAEKGVANVADVLDLKDPDNNKVDDDGKLKVNVRAGKDVQTQIEDALAALGYTKITPDSKTGGKYTYKATKGSFEETITCASADRTLVYLVTVDGTPTEFVKAGANSTAKSLAADTNLGFIKSVDGGDNWTFTEYDGNTKYASTAAADVLIKTGYLPTSGITLHANTTGAFNVSYKVGGSSVDALPVGVLPTQTIDVILTAKDEIDLEATTAGKVEAPNSTSITLKDNTIEDTNTGGTLTFKKAAGTKLTTGNTITVNYGAVSNKTKITSEIKYTAPTP